MSFISTILLGPARLRRAVRNTKLRELGVAREGCALCAFPWLVRLSDSSIGVRCPACGASAITESIAEIIQVKVPRLSDACVYEMSAVGPLAAFLRRAAGDVVTSEFLDGVPLGASRDGVLCQDVQRLTFDAESFDLCTSTEVFEHVEDDMAGFSEIRRVLRPGGWLVFTVPLDLCAVTVERTRSQDGVRVNVLPPEYHGDRYRGDTIFTYRNYGVDIVNRLLHAGFEFAAIEHPKRRLFGHARPVVVARR